MRAFGTYDEMDVTVSDILGRLRFGVNADDFERALDELSGALGFAGERPDKEWKEGPDNLWALDDTRYLLIECKSEVDAKCTDVGKREAEQMNRSAAWFAKHYPGMQVKRFDRASGHAHRERGGVYPRRGGMGVSELGKLEKAGPAFFKAFEGQNFADLSTQHIQRMVGAHHLSVDDLLTHYSRQLKNVK